MAMTVSAAAHPNLAFVKYWGQRDARLNLPANGSISVNLSGAVTTTAVTFDPTLAEDAIQLNGAPAVGVARQRVVAHLDRVRALAELEAPARVVSSNDFPAAVGLASSASAFAALSLAATRAAGLVLSERALTILARKGSGSACRSVPDGFVEWLKGEDDQSSYARTLAPADHWDIRVVTVAFVERAKLVTSLEGHRAAPASPFYRARLASVTERLDRVRASILARDFDTLGMTAEREAASLHAVAMTSSVATRPSLSGIYYLEAGTMDLIQRVQRWRAGGLPVYFTLDAGPTVHLLCEAVHLDEVRGRLAGFAEDRDVRVITSEPGRGAWLINTNGGV
ncbi:MAG: diphosphomevalonate decarboxylase [Anaerolineae bacterium]